jgi:hypothetical protein
MESLDYLLSLPDDVLIYKIFPYYSVSYFLSLCRLNQRFNNLCHNNKLWHYFTDRDFGINPIPQGFTNWRDIYMLYNDILTNPITAIPYVEDALLQQRSGAVLSPIQQMLIKKYEPYINTISYTKQNGDKVSFIIHMLEFHDPVTLKFIPATSFDQIKILQSNENAWRHLNSQEKEIFGDFLVILEQPFYANINFLPTNENTGLYYNPDNKETFKDLGLETKYFDPYFLLGLENEYILTHPEEF